MKTISKDQYTGFCTEVGNTGIDKMNKGSTGKTEIWAINLTKIPSQCYI